MIQWHQDKRISNFTFFPNRAKRKHNEKERDSKRFITKNAENLTWVKKTNEREGIINFRFSVPCIFYRSQIKVPNRCNYVYIFIVYVLTLHVSGSLLAHHQGCLGLLVHAAIWLMQCCCISMCLRTVQGHRPQTHGYTATLHEPNGGMN
jgi:hypothetical protein